MSEYIKLKLDVFDEPTQNISALRNLSIVELKGEILRKFQDLSHSDGDSYGLFLLGSHRPLEDKKSLQELNIQNGDSLTFGWVTGAASKRNGGKQLLPVGCTGKIVVQENKTTTVVGWQPFIIGRKTAGGKKNELIGIDCTGLTNDRRVSRNHAQILFADGAYYLVSLEERNPTYVNGKKLKVNEKIRLNHEDRIEVSTGRIQLIFVEK